MTDAEEKAAAAAIRLAEELGKAAPWMLVTHPHGRLYGTRFGLDARGHFFAEKPGIGSSGPTMPEAVAALRKRDTEREE